MLLASLLHGNNGLDPPLPISGEGPVCWSSARPAKSPRRGPGWLICSPNTLCGLPGKSRVWTGPTCAIVRPSWGTSSICDWNKDRLAGAKAEYEEDRPKPKWPTGGADDWGWGAGNGAFKAPGKMSWWKGMEGGVKVVGQTVQSKDKKRGRRYS